MAVDTGVHVLAVTVFRGLDHVEMDVADVFNDQRDIHLFCRQLCFLAAEEGRHKSDAGDIDSLTFETHGCQTAVESSGKEAQGFAHN